VFVSHISNAQTNDAVSAVLCGSSGCTPTTVISTGLNDRSTYTTPDQSAVLGTVHNLTISLSGNDGVTFAEFAATYLGTTYRWLTQTTLDGNSATYSPSVTLDVATAYTELTGTGYLLNITTVTGGSSQSSNSNSNSRHDVIVYGTNGFVGPLTLFNSVSTGATDNFSIDIPDIGTLVELKIINSGNDGWYLRTLTASHGSWTGRWSYDGWIDGNGNTATPHADVFVVTETACAAGPSTYVEQTTMCADGAFIFSQSDCATAASKMGRGNVTTAGSDWASGCLVHSGQVYFSPHSQGSTNNPTDSYICYTTPANPYGTSPTHCGPGNGMLSSAQCTTAATSLYSQQFQTAGPEWASGCLRHNGLIYYSPHTVGSNENPTDAYLCNVC